MEGVGANAQNAVAVVSACMEGVRVGAKSVAVVARFVSTKGEKVSAETAEPYACIKKRAFQMAEVVSKKRCNYHLFARIEMRGFLQMAEVASPKKSDHINSVSMANSQTCARIAMESVSASMAEKNGYAFLARAPVSAIMENPREYALNAEEAVSVCMEGISDYALNAEASVSACMEGVRTSAKIVKAARFARMESAKADVASVAAVKSVSTEGDMAIAKSAKKRVVRRAFYVPR